MERVNLISISYIKEWTHYCCVGGSSLFGSISMLLRSDLGNFGVVTFRSFIRGQNVKCGFTQHVSPVYTLIKVLIHNPHLRQTSIKLSWIMPEPHEI